MDSKKTNLLINSDMGEWDAPHLMASVDEEIMPFIDLCNIACGGHAGSRKIIRITLYDAIKNNVKIGAHPGFEDRKNFGRKYIPLNQQQLENSLKKQLNAFLLVCSKHKAQPYHIKAHGALYHACNQREMESEVLIDVVCQLCPDLILFVAPGSILQEKAKSQGIKTMTESFIDRKYNDDLTLVSRTESNSVILDINLAKEQFNLLSKGKIVTKSGKTKSLASDTACIHGDNPKVLQILKAIRNA